MEYLESDVWTWVKYPEKGIWYVKIPGQDGNWKSAKTTDKKEAIRWALARAMGGVDDAATIADAARNIYLPGKCDLIATREDDADGPRTRQHWHDMRQVVEDYLFPVWGRWRLESIPPAEFSKWLRTVKSKRKGEVLSGRIRKKIRDAMIEIGDWLVFTQKARYNPLHSVPKVSGAGQKRRKFTAAERAAMFPEDLAKVWPMGENVVSVLSPAWGVAAMLADEGLRPQEVLALHWEDYNWDERGWLVRRALTAGEIGDLKGTRTAGVKRRAVRVSERLDKILQVGKGLTGPVFTQKPDPEGKGPPPFLRIDTFGKVFCKALDRPQLGADGKPIKGPDGQAVPIVDRQGRTLYSLRHTKNTREVTEALAKVRQTMGHKTAAMTANYDDADDADLWRRAGD